jgi:hypothetical protein
MKIIVTVTAAFFATLSVAAAADLAPVAPEQPQRPIAEGVGAKPPAGIEHGEEREAAGGGSPEHNLQPPAGGQPGATVGGE